MNARLAFGILVCAVAALVFHALPLTVSSRSEPAKSGDSKLPPGGTSLAERVQRFYEKTNDFSADFQQVIKLKGMMRKSEASGTLQVKKPGMMRWDYQKPYPKQLIVDGSSLYLYEPDDQFVQQKQNFSGDTMSAAVTFLWGRGKLTDWFSVQEVNKPEYGPIVLELTPKGLKHVFTKIYFVMNEATGGIDKSIVFDTGGNESRITFTNVKTNQGIPDSRFHFEVPKGAQVTNLP